MQLSRADVPIVSVGEFEEPTPGDIFAWSAALLAILRDARAEGGYLKGNFILAQDVAERMYGSQMPFVECYCQLIYNNVLDNDGMNIYVQPSLPAGEVLLV